MKLNLLAGEQHFCSDTFKNWTTEELLDYIQSPTRAALTALAAFAEVEARVVERMMDLGMQAISHWAYAQHEERKQAKRNRFMGAL